MIPTFLSSCKIRIGICQCRSHFTRVRSNLSLYEKPVVTIALGFFIFAVTVTVGSTIVRLSAGQLVRKRSAHGPIDGTNSAAKDVATMLTAKEGTDSSRK
jgi:hypothetical protein